MMTIGLLIQKKFFGRIISIAWALELVLILSDSFLYIIIVVTDCGALIKYITRFRVILSVFKKIKL